MKKTVALFLMVSILCCSLCGCAKPFSKFKDFLKPQDNISNDNSSFSNESNDNEEKNIIKLDKYSAEIQVGDTLQINATVATGVELVWRSSNEDIALVNSKGLVTAVSSGVVNITCYTDYGKEAVCTVTITDSKKQTSVTQNDDYIFPNSSVAYLTNEEIAERLSSLTGSSVSTSHAQDAINEIFARNGLMYKDQKLQNYYMSKSWYTPISYNIDAENFNSFEKYNIEMLKKYR